MSSLLTRHVICRILANEPIVHRECLRRQAYSTIRKTTRSPQRRGGQHGTQLVKRPQRRTFFDNLFGQGNRKTNEANMDPGIEKMMELAKRERMRARLPSPEEIRDALAQFFGRAGGSKKGIEDLQARLALHSLRYCADRDRKLLEQDRAHKELPQPSILHLIVGALQRSTKTATAQHLELASFVWELAIKDGLEAGSTDVGLVTRALSMYLTMLGVQGQARKALEVMLTYESLAAKQSANARFDVNQLAHDEQLQESSPAPAMSVDPLQLGNMWPLVLEGFAQQDDETELLKSLDELRSRGYHQNARTAYAMLSFYLRRDDTEAVKLWFRQIWRGKTPEPRVGGLLLKTRRDVFDGVLRWCLQHNQFDFGHEVVRQAIQEHPPKQIWDSIFVWAAGTGKGADEIDRMLTVMEDSNKNLPVGTYRRVPDIDLINNLVEFATSKNDPYLAERFIALGRTRNIQPDARTYVLQMEYRLKINDVDGALTAYKSLQSMDLSSEQDLPAVNKLVVALCRSRRHDFETIMNVAADLSDRRALFDPSTASALALLHLNRDEVQDVLDLLNTHSFQYSSTEREGIRNDIVAFCLNPNTPTVWAWDGFTVLRGVFDEMPRSQRTELMIEFFRRERPDMAAHIFNGMRMHSRDDTIPNVDTYVAAFLGSAKIRDLNSLEIIHNQLKLDFNIDSTTYLLNALIIGYTACGRARYALKFWHDIVVSKEGPTHNSIHVALRACERAPFGDVRAQEIWANLRKRRVELDQSMWASYVAALAGNGDTELAISTVEEAEDKGELQVDVFLLGSLLDGCPGQTKQAEVEAWAKERHHQIWEELEKLGIDEDENEMKIPRIDRTVTP